MRPRACCGCLAVPLLLLLICYLVTFFQVGQPYLEARSRWNSAQIRDYSVQVSYGTLADNYDHSSEMVQDGRLVQRVNLSTGHADVYPARSPVIDLQFDSVAFYLLLPFGFYLCDVQYEPVSGFPSRTVENDFDLGIVIEITSFVPE